MKTHSLKPRSSLIVTSRLALLLLLTMPALAGTWTRLNNLPPHYVNSPILLTDGTIIVQEVHSGGLGTGLWWKLTPDNTGAYLNGTWTQIATMPNGYAPEDYASAVLPDGRVIVEGGEYNGNNGSAVWTNQGAIYDPVANTWTAVAPPTGWAHIGDSQSVVLPDGSFMITDVFDGSQTMQAVLNPTTLTWTIVGSTGKVDRNDEEGWTLLPNGKVLTVDVWSIQNTEVYDPSTETWSYAGTTPTSLVSTAVCEIGPAVLRPDGTVVQFGGNGHTAIYSSATGWASGPTMPNSYMAQDTPAAQLPSGNILIGMTTTGSGPCSSPSYPQNIYFYEFNGTGFSFVGGPTNNYPWENRLLMLPSGNVFWTRDSDDIRIYTPNSSVYQAAWQPTVSSYPGSVTRGSKNNFIYGTQFNGLTQSSMYGDDYQAATNYPLVRIKNNATGHVFYCRTHDHSTMGVATGSTSVSTEFDVPAGAETGASQLFVVANGIPSNPVSVTVQ